jgi:hypothetical protein
MLQFLLMRQDWGGDDMLMDHIQYLDKSFEYSDIAGYTTPGWYFWDETGAHCHGPCKDANEANEKLNLYCKLELGH